MPFGLVFAFFFIIPLILVVIVSFWDYNDYAMLPSFTTRSYTETFEGCLDSAARSLHDPQNLCVDGEILLHRLAHHAPHRLHDRLFPRLPHPLDDDADGAVSRLHHSVLDLERHPHDLVDSAARTQRARQRCAHARPYRRQASRMATLFALLGVARVHPSFHLLHGRADLQFDDAHRQASRRGGLRFRRLRMADVVEPDRSPVQAWHRHRIDLRRDDRYGRFHHLRRDGRRADRLGRQGGRDAAQRTAISSCRCERGDSACRHASHHHGLNRVVDVHKEL